MSRIIKSIAYLLIGGGIGVGFFAVCKPSPAEIEQIRNVQHHKNIREVVKNAAETDEPIYRKSSKEIQKLLTPEKADAAKKN